MSAYRYEAKIKNLKKQLSESRWSKDPQKELTEEAVIEIEQQIQDLEIAAELANERLKETQK